MSVKHVLLALGLIATSTFASAKNEAVDIIAKPSATLKLVKVDGTPVKGQRVQARGLVHSLVVEQTLKTDGAGTPVLQKPLTYTCTFPKAGVFFFESRPTPQTERGLEFWVAGKVGAAVCQQSQAGA